MCALVFVCVRRCVFLSRVASSKCVSCIPVENSHLQPLSSPSTFKHSPKPLSLWLYASLKSSSVLTVPSLLSSDRWICEVPFIYSLFSFLHLFTEPQPETGTHFHLYGKLFSIDKTGQGTFISCRFFSC